MIGDTPDFDFGLEFPKRKGSSKKGTKRSRAVEKLKSIPKGARFLIEQRVMFCGRTIRHVHDFYCPSDACDFVVKGTLNKEAGKRTLETHIKLDHKSRKK